MPDLDAVESRSNKRLQSFAASSLRRVSPNSQCAGIVSHRDSVFDREFILGDERAAVAAKISHERVLEIVHHAAGNECARDVRPAHCSPVRLHQNIVERDRNPKCVELVDDPLGARVSKRAEFSQPLLETLET